MKTTREAIPNEKEYRQGGYFVMDKIITWRCDVCFQHMSLMKYEVKGGKVSPDIYCGNCKTTHEDVRLDNFKGVKQKEEIYSK